MELTAASIGASAGKILLPIAYRQAKSCWASYCRDAKDIKKHVILLPKKGGKSYLKAMLNKSTQRVYWVLDLDEEVTRIVPTDNTVIVKKTLEAMETAKKENDHFGFETSYNKLASMVLDNVKAQLKVNPKLRVVFLTSVYAFVARKSRTDGIVALCPDSDFHEKIVASADESERDDIRRGREDYLKSIPAGSTITTYDSYDELQRLVRARLGIVPTL